MRILIQRWAATLDKWGFSWHSIRSSWAWPLTLAWHRSCQRSVPVFNLLPCDLLVRTKWKQSVRQTACPPTALFATENLVDATAALTHPSPVARVLYSLQEHGPPPTPLSVTSSPAPLLCLHINTVIDHPHVPVNLLMRRHWSCRVPLPSWGRMTRLHILFSPTPTAWWTAAPNWPTELATGRLDARWDKYVAYCDAWAWEI